MYPVTQDFLDKMKADRRQVLARVAIDYTDPFIDQSIQIEASEQANVSYPRQTADSVDQTTCKYACLDGTWDLASGEYHLAPSADQLAQRQFGWWGAQFCDQDGYFASPYPTLTVRHSPRPMRQLKVVGDTARGEYPVDFTVKLYGPDDTLLKTETVTGNDQVSWQKALEPQVPDVAKQVLEITKWSLPGTCVKIIEFFTSIREVYETGDLVSLRLLEEREASQGSLPVGNISSNEITLALNNESKKFDVDNDQSPLKNLLKPNRRIQAWLGLKGGGEGMDIQRNVDFSQGELNNLVVVNNKLQLPDVGSPSFSRNSVAHLSDGTQVAANQPRFEQGKFGEAIMVEEGTTNLLLYSEGFTQSVWAKLRVNASSAGTYLGYPVTRFTPNVPGQVSFVSQIFLASGTANRTFTWSFWARGQTNRQFKVNFHGGVSATFYTINLTTEWQKFTITHTFPSDAISARIQWGNVSPYWGIEYTDWIEVAGVQVEEKPYATSYIKTTSSSATRSPETLTIPAAGVLNPQEGTVELWVKAQDLYIRRRDVFATNSAAMADDRIILGYNVTLSGLQLYWRPANAVEYSLNVPGINPTTEWVQLGFKYKWNGSSGYDLAVIYNGQIAQTGTSTNGQMTNFYQVIIGGVSAQACNSLIDDLRISNRARTDEEILAAYQSGQPLPVDEWTTYKLGFDGSLNFGQGGYYISPEYDLSAVGTAATSAITWQEDADGVQRTVYAKLDNQSDWTQVQNGGKLPISTGGVLTGRKLQIKTKLIRV